MGERRPEGFPGQRLVVVPPEIVTAACRRPVTRDLCVTHIGAYSAASGHYVERPAGSVQHILIACLAGSGRCRFSGREWPLAAGELLFLPPRMAHVYESAMDAPWTIFWIHFRGLRVGDHLANLGVGREPPLSLLIRLRLQRAMDLLQRGNHNVAEAARAVGYEDPFYFSRLFKKHIGVTPSSCMHGP